MPQADEHFKEKDIICMEISFPITLSICPIKYKKKDRKKGFDQ